MRAPPGHASLRGCGDWGLLPFRKKIVHLAAVSRQRLRSAGEADVSGRVQAMAPRTLLISKRNSAYQVLESLATNRQKRNRTRTFLVEGVQPINMALANQWPFTALAYQSGSKQSRWAADVLSRAPTADRYEIAPDLFGALSRKDEPSELLAIVGMPDDSLERIRLDPHLLVVVVDRPGNPGNLGTLIRSCDAFGVNGIILSGHGVDLYEPATLTASRGSLFAVPTVRVQSHEDTIHWV